MSSTPEDGEPVTFLWATRGRSWGFRFLRRAGLRDPLTAYERAFAGVESTTEVFRRLRNGSVAVRFPDPDDRRDSAGRIVPHDFVVLGQQAKSFESLEHARARLWPLVAAEYAAWWDEPTPPPAHD